ncbi:recombination mediator RecR [Planctomicrobium piriforme]|uniref:Recombination protein RecR n=1 Tax=Planctomicrobium piriforme TaxID=1576369 RepID=A0A1I3C9T9_9PLAN|nr:recombination mediator RecR [Planctomicrobium piriforme]SFH71247.1 DNA replication and repair protein RecR [Planctomicrobium piriforme]
MASRGFQVEQHPFGPAVGRLVEQFAALPGIGRKSAERLANHILSCSTPEAMALATAIHEVKKTIRRCSVCFNLTEQELCVLCRDPRRDRTVVCVVEQPKDVSALEAAAAFQGTYHVLGGRIAPLEGVGPEDLTIGPLVQRVKRDHVKELIMATNPTLEGDGTALFISNLLEEQQVEITRLARGIATGSVLEFANKEMLADAMRGRQHF